ncbi:MAG: hypothetical protein ABSG03_23685 [Bryobacteraceae bacterium]
MKHQLEQFRSAQPTRTKLRESAPPDWASLLRAWRETAGMNSDYPTTPILVAVEAIDARKGIDRLAGFPKSPPPAHPHLTEGDRDFQAEAKQAT